MPYNVFWFTGAEHIEAAGWVTPSRHNSIAIGPVDGLHEHVAERNRAERRPKHDVEALAYARLHN